MFTSLRSSCIDIFTVRSRGHSERCHLDEIGAVRNKVLDKNEGRGGCVLVSESCAGGQVHSVTPYDSILLAGWWTPGHVECVRTLHVH